MSTSSIIISQEVLADHLKCPICLSIPIPPITMCRTGHLICGTCRKSDQKCGICQADYTETRNFAVEGMVQNLEIECNNAPRECQLESTAATLRPQQQSYNFRFVIFLKIFIETTNDVS